MSLSTCIPCGIANDTARTTPDLTSPIITHSPPTHHQHHQLTLFDTKHRFFPGFLFLPPSISLADLLLSFMLHMVTCLRHRAPGMSMFHVPCTFPFFFLSHMDSSCAIVLRCQFPPSPSPLPFLRLLTHVNSINRGSMVCTPALTPALVTGGNDWLASWSALCVFFSCFGGVCNL